MDPTLKQLITSTVTFAIASAFIILHAKHNDDIQSLCKMFQKTFSSKKSSSSSDAQTPSNPAINYVSASSPDLASKGP